MAGRTRRANGEASFFRDAEGRWHGYVSLGRRPDGRPDRRHRRGRTRQEVVDKVQALVRTYDAGAVMSSETTTLADWLGHWIVHVAPDRVRRKSLASYRTDVVKHLIPHLGQVRLQRLTWVEIEAFEARMRALTFTDASGATRHYRPTTIAHVRRTLRSALAHAVRLRIIVINPASQVRPVVDQSLTSADFVAKVLDVEEAQHVIQVARQRDGGVRHVLRLIYGPRQGEMLGLGWDRVVLDPMRPSMTIDRQLQRHTWSHGCGSPVGDVGAEVWPCGARRGADCPYASGGGLVLVRVKTKRTERTLLLHPDCTEMLRAHRVAQAAKRLAAGPLWQENGLVFTQETGAPIDPRADAKDWHDLLDEAGVRQVRLHDARHTAATNLYRGGARDPEVMALMGWSSPAMLQRYRHVDGEAATAASTRAADQLLSSGSAQNQPRRG